MAKWGEGDPRWIVEERPDAVNVNNWHWTEKNASVWSKDVLKDLLTCVKFEDPDGSGSLTEVTSITGDASANNRKGKLIFFYEWDIKLKWTAVPANGGKEVKGDITIPNLSEENDLEDIDVTVTTDSDVVGAYKMKQLWIRVGTSLILEKLALYIRKLKQEFTQGMILPITKDQSLKVQEGSNSLPVSVVAKGPSNGGNGSTSAGLRVPTVKITMTQEFQCRVEDLYSVLTEPAKVQVFAGNTAKVDAVKGGEFLLFDGNISGKFLQLEPNERIVQHWRCKDWPAGLYSTVKMELEQDSYGTKLILTQTGVPQSEYNRTEDNWSRYYWERIRNFFGFGAKLY